MLRKTFGGAARSDFQTGEHHFGQHQHTFPPLFRRVSNCWPRPVRSRNAARATLSRAVWRCGNPESYRPAPPLPVARGAGSQIGSMTTEQKQAVTFWLLVAILVLSSIVVVGNWQLYSRVEALENSRAAQEQP